MRYHIARRSTETPPPATTVLGTIAAQLSAGQSMLVPVTITRPTIAPDADPRPITKWSNSGFYDPVNKRMLFNGKRESNLYPYWTFEYDEVTNVASVGPAWDTALVSGHGYNHSTGNPATGEYFHRQYNDVSGPYKLVGDTWSQLPAIGGAVSFASSLTYVPGLGLLTVDPVRMRLFNGSTWSLFKTLGGVDQNHNIAIHNPISNIMLFGSGNSSDNCFTMDCSGSPYTVTAIATPPYNIGSSNTQGNIVANPNGPGFIIHDKGTTSWHHWTPAGGVWNALSQSSGGGSTPQTGMPNLVTGAAGADIGCATILVNVPTHGIFLALEYIGTAGGQLWACKPNG